MYLDSKLIDHFKYLVYILKESFYNSRAIQIYDNTVAAHKEILGQISLKRFLFSKKVERQKL